MSYRRLWVLVQQLPMESRTQTFLRDKPAAELVEPPSGPAKFGPWSQRDYLLALLIDAVRQGNYVSAVAARIEPKPKPPEPVPRPGLDRPRRVQSEANVLYLKNLRARG